MNEFSKIILGKSGETDATLDVNELISTRLLIQGNSGAGKSWLIRRICEQLFGKIPVIIIDPEGDFPSLRKKFDYVLVGQNGETPAQVDTAQMVAHRLLDLRASAVCDIYELKPRERHEWVRLFLEAIIDAPKSLWRPTIIVVDEAHIFCPEKGQGESEASEAMKDLATRGRKRGFAGIYATQRIAMLSKTVTAQMLNRLVGMTFEDIDLDRAADLLSITRQERLDFNSQMKVIDPGYFYGIGRAISKERILIRVGPVQTSHPKPGSADYGAAPPPAPEKVKALISRLADIPQAVAEKAHTETELRMEIKSLRDQLILAQQEKPVREVVKQAPPKIETRLKIKEVKIPLVKERQIKRLEKTLDRAEKLVERTEALGKPFFESASKLRNSIASLLSVDPAKILGDEEKKFADAQKEQEKVAGVERAVTEKKTEAPADPADTALTNPRLAILRGLRELLHLDIDVPSRDHLAGWLGIKVTGSFRNNLGALRTGGYVNYEGDGVLLTSEGLKVAPPSSVQVTSQAIFEHVLGAVTGPQAEILKVLRAKHPEWMAREDVAAALGIAVTGSFRNNLGRLHSSQMIEYGSGEKKNCLKCAGWMFVNKSPAPAQVGEAAV